MKNHLYIISDIESFTNYIRALVFNNFGSKKTEEDETPTNSDDIINNMTVISPDDQDELDRVLSFDESLIIINQLVKKQVNRKTDKTRFLVDDKSFISIIESLNDRMVSNLLNSLVNRGLIETGYDSESNDFVFWIKDNNQDQIESD